MQAYYNFIDTTEKVLTPMGFMEGEAAVPKRMLLGGILGATAVVLLKPASMFENGVARPWTFLSAGDERGPKPTSTPWFIGPFIGAVFLGMFV